MKNKRRIKEEIKILLYLFILLLLLLLSIYLLIIQDKKEKEKAIKENRTEIHYTFDGEVYYK